MRLSYWKSTSYLIVSLFLFVSSCATGTSRYHDIGHKESLRLYQTIDSFGQHYASKHDMQLLIVGDITNTRNSTFGMLLDSHSPTSLEEGRLVAADLIQQFWEMLKSNQVVKEYVAAACREHPQWYPRQVELRQIGIKIDYWDHNVDRIKSPYLAEILLEDTILHYYQADPETQELRLIYQESYKEALANLEKTQS